jgi:hypothetical protein
MSGLLPERASGRRHCVAFSVLGVALLLAAGAVGTTPAAAEELSADLSVSFPPSSNYRTQFVVGERPTALIILRNTGPSDAQHVAVRTSTPDGLAFDHADYYTGGYYPQPVSCAAGSNEFTCDLGAIAAGKRPSLLVTFLPATATGIYEISSTVSSDTADPDGSNNVATETITIYAAYAGAFAARIAGSVPTVGVVSAERSTPGDSYEFGPTFDPDYNLSVWTYEVMASVNEAHVYAHFQTGGVALIYNAIVADSVDVTCVADATSRGASTRFGSLDIYTVGYEEYTPPPNTVISVPVGPSLRGSLTLNEQTVSGGTITVSALHLRVHSKLTGNLVTDVAVGLTVCGISP